MLRKYSVVVLETYNQTRMSQDLNGKKFRLKQGEE
jgi:hypothetical protein